MQPGKSTLSRDIASKEKCIQLRQFCRDTTTRRYWREIGPSLAEEGRSSLHSLLDFGRRVGWWRIALCLSCYALGLAAAVILPLLYLLRWAADYSGGDTCRPDGKFALGVGEKYKLWDVSGIFQISMAFGAMSFSNAKLVDVVWDVVSRYTWVNNSSVLAESCLGDRSWFSGCFGSGSLRSDHQESHDVHGASFCTNRDF